MAGTAPAGTSSATNFAAASGSAAATVGTAGSITAATPTAKVNIGVKGITRAVVMAAPTWGGHSGAVTAVAVTRAVVTAAASTADSWWRQAGTGKATPIVLMLGVVAVICRMRERIFGSTRDVFDDGTSSID